MAESGERTTAPLGFRSHLHVEHVPGEAVYVLSDARTTALHGDQIAALAPLLDGTRPFEQLVRDAAGSLSAEQTASLVARLSAAGLVTARHRPDGPGRESAEAAYWEAAGLHAGEAASARVAARVAARAVGGADPAELRQALDQAGLAAAGPGEHADLTVVLCDDYLDPGLGDMDAEHRATGRPWLPVMTRGTQVWAGPFLGVEGRACWSCLADRLWRGRQVERHVQRALDRVGPVPRPDFGLAAARRAGLHLAVLEAVKWAAGHRHPGQRSLWTVDTLTLQAGHHPVQRRPQCAGCGDPGLVAARARAPLRLGSRTKHDTSGGGHRALPPQELLAQYGHLVDSVTGLVREIRQDPRGPAFLNSFHAGLNPVADPRGLGSVRAGLRATSGGKGRTELQARTGALAEALERCSGHFHGDEPVVRGSYRELAPEAVHPDSVQLFDVRQFAGRDVWNATHAPAQHVCDPFDEDAPTDWTPVWSVTAGRHRLLPTASLYYYAPQQGGRAPFVATSNGAAAGGCLEDAVLQGTLELVERDAVAVWWYNRLRVPGVDLDAFADPWTEELRQVHRALHREVWALDLTSDLGVPVFAALSRRTDKPAEDVMLGFGAHFDPRIALGRALAELNQLLPPVALARADGSGYELTDPVALDWLRTATVAEQPYLAADGGLPRTRPETHPHAPRTDLLEDLDDIEGRLRERGMELLVLDQTRPDIQLPVVKVVVPGLRPHWPRFAPGRLFDVPVTLGRRRAPTPYEELNPVPLFL